MPGSISSPGDQPQPWQQMKGSHQQVDIGAIPPGHKLPAAVQNVFGRLLSRTTVSSALIVEVGAASKTQRFGRGKRSRHLCHQGRLSRCSWS